MDIKLRIEKLTDTIQYYYTINTIVYFFVPYNRQYSFCIHIFYIIYYYNYAHHPKYTSDGIPNSIMVSLLLARENGREPRGFYVDNNAYNGTMTFFVMARSLSS